MFSSSTSSFTSLPPGLKVVRVNGTERPINSMGSGATCFHAVKAKANMDMSLREIYD